MQKVRHASEHGILHIHGSESKVICLYLIQVHQNETESSPLSKTGNESYKHKLISKFANEHNIGTIISQQMNHFFPLQDAFYSWWLRIVQDFQYLHFSHQISTKTSHYFNITRRSKKRRSKSTSSCRSFSFHRHLSEDRGNPSKDGRRKKIESKLEPNGRH